MFANKPLLLWECPDTKHNNQQPETQNKCKLLALSTTNSNLSHCLSSSVLLGWCINCSDNQTCWWGSTVCWCCCYLLRKKKKRNPKFSSGWKLKQDSDVSQHVDILRVSLLPKIILKWVLPSLWTWIAKICENDLKMYSISLSLKAFILFPSFLLQILNWVGYTMLPFCIFFCPLTPKYYL